MVSRARPIAVCHMVPSTTDSGVLRFRGFSFLDLAKLEMMVTQSRGSKNELQMKALNRARLCTQAIFTKVHLSGCAANESNAKLTADSIMSVQETTGSTSRQRMHAQTSCDL
eukprot:1595837-Amphidinium_carterae.1